MRVGLVIYGSLEILSGGYLYDRELVKYLESCGDQVEVIALPWRNYRQHLTDNFSQRFYQRLAGLDIDILVQDELNHASLFLVNNRLKKKFDTPIISIVHHLRCSEENHFLWNEFYRIIERGYLKTVDGFVYNSHSTREVVESMIGEEKKSVVSYPAGNRLRPSITAQQIHMRTSQDGPLQVLFLGNVISRKGLHILLEALEEIPKEQWFLSIVGSLEMDKDYVNRIMDEVRKKGLTDSIEFFGPLDEGELKNIMQASQLMVMPSSYEGFGIAYLEGMGYGLPAIASTAGGAPEIITPGKNGFLVPPDDPGSLHDYLLQLIADRDLLAEMSQAALERYHCHPTWEDTSKRTREFLVSMISQKERS